MGKDRSCKKGPGTTRTTRSSRPENDTQAVGARTPAGVLARVGRAMRRVTREEVRADGR